MAKSDLRRPRIVLADDNPVVLREIRPLLESQFEVVAVAGDGEALIEQALRLTPDVVVTDIAMPGLDGISAARRIQRAVPGTRIVFLTVHSDAALVEEARSMGTAGYVVKTFADVDLVEAVREALAGRAFFSPAV